MTYDIGADIIDRLVRERAEPGLEVAGPTFYGGLSGLSAYTIWNGLEMPPGKLYVSNLYLPGSPGRGQTVDLQLNAAHLPFRDRCLGLIAASSLWDFEMVNGEKVWGLQSRFLAEARRCLVPGGLLVAARLQSKTMWSTPWRLGLALLRAEQPPNDPDVWNAIFLKGRPPV
jgi:hypothetical protein